MGRAYRLLAMPVLWCLFALQAQGAPIVLSNTGYQLPASVHDPFYDITAGPSGAEDLYVVRSDGYPFLDHLWTPNSGNAAQWIAPRGDYLARPADLPGVYWYQTTFDLTGFHPSTARITGEWASDNCGEIYLNEAATGQSTGVAPNCLAIMHPFALTTGFVGGVNTLAFRVENLPGDTSNPTGIIVSLSGTADTAPEPAALALLGSGLLGVWLLRRRDPHA